jgi:hypothetical protein
MVTDGHCQRTEQHNFSRMLVKVIENVQHDPAQFRTSPRDDAHAAPERRPGTAICG